MTVGVDISKEDLATAILDGPVSTFPNTKTGVGNLLANLSAGSTIAMEATGKFHRLLADTAYEQGFRVLVFNPKDVLHYGRSISPRAKTDPVNAGVIAMFACVRKHRTYQPLPPLIEMLRSLVRTRASLVRERVSHENQARTSRFPVLSRRCRHRHCRVYKEPGHSDPDSCRQPSSV